ncbi:hypothetical protein CAI21_22175 [Alkalilimnicola ehrlichii]|uniref:Uncharacterized protein n=1 Tax=Alkalilimnicola ehrlichii TaxID=351052 RepID=A0A3E0WGA3_9GAMM|nr:hypothetical protein [Alkalilimnicola ehrlichii]RFA24312.1 hypothetical protein CAI21_22175 [Alkalilimnicola ehrlichii]RFA31549.1 hypothetical protein CAL65_22275 [Alkalilimnicola ehrlichii]
MITWLQLLPVFPVVWLVLFVVGLVPTVDFNGHYLGGAYSRLDARDGFFWLPTDTRLTLALWAANARLEHAVLFHAVVATNFFAFVLPFLYMILACFLHVRNWFARETVAGLNR